MITQIRDFLTRGSQKDAAWFAVEASPDTKKRIIEEIAEESSKDQRDLVREYRQSRLRA